MVWRTLTFERLWCVFLVLSLSCIAPPVITQNLKNPLQSIFYDGCSRTPTPRIIVDGFSAILGSVYTIHKLIVGTSYRFQRLSLNFSIFIIALNYIFNTKSLEHTKVLLALPLIKYEVSFGAVDKHVIVNKTQKGSRRCFRYGARNWKFSLIFYQTLCLLSFNRFLL